MRRRQNATCKQIGLAGTLAIVLVAAGCSDNESEPPASRTAADPAASRLETAPSSHARKYDVMLVYRDPEGQEVETAIEGDGVAEVHKTLQMDSGEELRIRLTFLRHDQGQDIYELELNQSLDAGSQRGLKAGVSYSGSAEEVAWRGEFGTLIFRAIEP